MSIEIDKQKCIGCSKCINICPGGLICKYKDNKAHNKYPEDCWGCAACIKECNEGAIKYYLADDIGGKGAYLYTKYSKDSIDFHIVKNNKNIVISVNKKVSNKY